MSNPEFKNLLQRYNAGNCTDDEKALIESWYMKFELSKADGLSDEEIEGILSMQVPVAPAPKRSSIWKWTAAAAVILVVIGLGIYTLNRPTNSAPELTNVLTDVAPGANKAVLTLADGKKIILDGARAGVLANEGNATISKSADGEVSYATENNTDANLVLFNTMTTPRGGQYQLSLADGTKVWLNAASAITYPTRFGTSERQVEITGEAYFEVAHDAKRPFKVRSNGQTIEVLGTHFNVNTYNDEPAVKTTLLQGSVRVITSGKTEMLKPGEQAIVSTNGLKVVKPDMEEVMAWHNGDFIFNGNGVEEIMRTVARWYDIEVSYEQYKPTKQTFTGIVSRSRNLSAVIKMMEKSTAAVKFEIRGKKVIVSN